MTRESQIAFAARSRSADASTIAGALPPSSRFTRVRVGAAFSMIRLPTDTDPVMEIIPTSGWVLRVSPTTRPRPLTRLNTPAGTPASSTSFANSRALTGVSDDGLITMVLPVSNAGAILRAMRKNGKFHGKMPPTTPMGRRVSRIISPARSDGITSPSIRRAHSAM